MLYMAKRRAAKRGHPFELDVTWVLTQLVQNRYRCAKTGIHLRLAHPVTGKSLNAFAPSIDRVDSSLGYTPENCQLVCLIYNHAKNTYSEDDLLKFAVGVLTHESIVLDNNYREGKCTP